MDASTSRWGRWQHKGAYQTILTHTYIGTLQHNIWVVPTMLPGSIVATRVFVATARLSIVATEVRTFDIVATDIWIRAAPTPVANRKGRGPLSQLKKSRPAFFLPTGSFSLAAAHAQVDQQYSSTKWKADHIQGKRTLMWYFRWERKG